MTPELPFSNFVSIANVKVTLVEDRKSEWKGSVECMS